jgi:hypothetical protein
VMEIASPPQGDEEECDEAAYLITSGSPDSMTRAGAVVGWQEYELLLGMLTAVMERIAEASSNPIAGEVLKIADDMLRSRIMTEQYQAPKDQTMHRPRQRVY